MDSLLANDIFVHYFAESELEKYNEETNNAEAPFDGFLARHLNLTN